MALKSGESERSTYLGLIHDLLGSATCSERSKVFPKEVKYVLVALSCQDGPLADLLVTSGVLIEAPATPARLSLLPRSSVWANHAIETCFMETVPPARIAEARQELALLLFLLDFQDFPRLNKLNPVPFSLQWNNSIS